MGLIVLISGSAVLPLYGRKLCCPWFSLLIVIPWCRLESASPMQRVAREAGAYVGEYCLVV